MKSSNDTTCLAGLLSAALSLLFLLAALGVPSLNTAISSYGNVNLLSYAGCVILFCLACLLFCRIFTLLNLTLWLPTTASRILTALLLLGTASFLGRSFLLEGNITGGVSYKYIWHKLPFPLVALVTILGLLVFIGIWRFQELTVRKWIWPLYYGVLSLLIGYTFYTPNVFGRYEAADTAHGHAYFNSVYNVYYGLPYTENTTSIYGHYGLFYRLPWKLLGGTFTAFVLLTAVIGALCFLCSFLTLHLMCKSSLVRLMGCLAMTLPILSMRGGYYWQLWPHRILFPAVMTLFAACIIKSQKLNWLTGGLGYVIALLAVIWNTESGLFCAVAWAGVLLLFELSEKRTALSFVRCVLFQIIGVLASFFGAFAIVNLYNHLQGAPSNPLTEFLFPLISSDYMTDLLRMDLPLYPSAWIPMLLLFLAGLGIGISQIRWFRRHNEASIQFSEKKQAAVLTLPLFCFFLSVLSLGQLTYFINRPAYHNLDICHIPAILLAAVLAAEGLPLLRALAQEKKNKKTLSQVFRAFFSLVTSCTLAVICAGTLIQYSYNADIKTNYHNMAEFESFAQSITSDVPPNTYAFGVSAAEVYSVLGWATNCYTLDFTDLSLRPSVAEYIVEDMKAKDVPAVFTGQATIEKMKKFAPETAEWLLANYAETKTYEFGGSTFRYFVKKS